MLSILNRPSDVFAVAWKALVTFPGHLTAVIGLAEVREIIRDFDEAPVA